MEGIAPAPPLRRHVRGGLDMKSDDIRGRPSPENEAARHSRGGEARPKAFEGDNPSAITAKPCLLQAARAKAAKGADRGSKRSAPRGRSPQPPSSRG